METTRTSRVFELIATPLHPKVCHPGSGVHSHARTPASQLSKNAVDIESFLRGTRVNDLTSSMGFNNGISAPPLFLNEISSLHLVRPAASAETVVLPKNLVVHSNQRPSLFSS
jgi:hypothetical protein